MLSYCPENEDGDNGKRQEQDSTKGREQKNHRHTITYLYGRGG